MGKRAAGVNPYASLFEKSSPIHSSGQFVKVIAFCTNDDYALEMGQLHESLDKFALCYETFRVRGLGDWYSAVTYKPRFILNALRDTQSEAVFYIDADATFRKMPDWRIFEGCDVSWHTLKRSPQHQEEHLTGSMFFRNSPDVRLLVESWAQESEREIYKTQLCPEQVSLKVVMERTADVKWKPLPASWVWFDDLREIYGEKEEAVIRHRQVSRKYRQVQQGEAEKADFTFPG